MAKNTHIQWTDNTWNPWHGCKKVSPGCKYCYMYRDKDRYGQDATKVIRSKKFNEPLKWKEPAKIFTCSWSDFFIEKADKWRPEAWEIIKQTPHLTYQILTKRPERIEKCLPEDWGDGYKNVWLGVSIENQEMADKRIPILLSIPAHIRFLSCEPLLGAIDLTDIRLGYEFHITHNVLSGIPYDWEYGDTIEDDRTPNTINWVIIGGESGNETGKYKYRPAKIEWFNEIVRQCKKNDVPVFIKQLGTYLAKEWKLKHRNGGDVNEFSEDLTVREFPNQ